MLNDNKKRIPYTFRMNSELNEKISREADKLGITKNAYITIILHQAMKEEKCS